MSKPKATPSVTESDLVVVSGQLGRAARDVTGVAVRCPWGRPAVIETAPLLAGKPNPTLLYLTCPTATVSISTVEAAGGVKRFKAVAREDEELRRALHEVIQAYKRRRGELAGPDGDLRPEAGIGGPESPEKASCLHAYAAALLAALSGWFARIGPDAATAADQAWDRFLPPQETLWCTDDRCARWVAGGGASEAGSEAVGDDLAQSAAARRVAAIDIGTISVRLLVADIRAGRPEELFRQAEITRLGEGLRPGRPLDAPARERTAAVVAHFVSEARRLGAERILVAGTSACREASDGPEFVQALGIVHGATAVVLTGGDEASLAYTGAVLDVIDRPVVLDVGGGSTELIRLTDGGTVESVSLALGASRGTERWLHSDPPLAEDMQALLEEATSLIDPLRPRFGREIAEAGPKPTAGAGSAAPAGGARLVGVAGTVTTLACLDADLDAYDAQIIHLRTLSLESIDRLIAVLAAMTTAERAALPCVQAGRAPVMVAGALIVRAAMQTLGYDEMTISERDILDGLALAAAC